MIEKLLENVIKKSGLDIEVIEAFDGQRIEFEKDDFRFEEVEIIGSMAGVPSKTESSSSYVVKGKNKKSFIVDVGHGGISRDVQNVGGRIGLPNLVFLTHLHADHAAGLAEYARYKETRTLFDNKKGELTIVLKNTIRSLWKILEVVSAFLAVGEKNTCVKIRFILVEAGCKYEINGLSVETFEVQHDETSIGYVFREINPVSKLDTKRHSKSGVDKRKNLGSESEGFLVVEELKSIVFYGDTVYLKENDKYAMGANLAVHEGTYMEDVSREFALVRRHSYVHEVVNLSGIAEKVLLAHHSRRYTNDERVSRIESELKNQGIEGNNILIAESGMKIEI